MGEPKIVAIPPKMEVLFGMCPKPKRSHVSELVPIMAARVLPAERMSAELLERARGQVHPTDKARPLAKS